MGWGKSGDVNDPDAGIWDFHRGYNVVREYVSNKIRYGFEDPNNGGLELEAVANSGDSGGAATIELADGTRKLIGVCSNGLVDTVYRDPNFPWMNEYAAVSGWQRRWITDNLDSLELGARVEADDQNCNAITYDTCQDTNFDSAGGLITDPYGDDCIAYSYFPGWCGKYDSNTFRASEMCCACNGGQTPRDEDSDGDGGDGGDGGVGPSPEAQALVQAAKNAAADAQALVAGQSEQLEIISAKLQEMALEGITVVEQERLAVDSAALVAGYL